MTRLLIATLLLTGCATVVAPADGGSGADAAIDAFDAAVDGAPADTVVPEASADAALSCVPVGAPAPTAIVTAADLAFPEPVVTLEDFLRWYERFHYLDLLRCPHDNQRGWASTLYADVAPFDSDRWGITQRWRFLVTTGVVRFDPDAAIECLRDLRAEPACDYPPMYVYPSCRRAITGGVSQGAGCSDDVQCAPGLRCNGMGNHATCVPMPPLRRLPPGSTERCDYVDYQGWSRDDALWHVPNGGMTRCASGEACSYDDQSSTYHCHRPIGIGCQGPASGTLCPPGYHAESVSAPIAFVQCDPIGALPPFGGVGAPCLFWYGVDHPELADLDTYAVSGRLRCADGLRCAFASREADLPTCLPRSADYACDAANRRVGVPADGPSSYCDPHTGRFETPGSNGAPCLDHWCVSEYCAYVTSDQASPENRCASHIAPDGGIVY